MTTPKPVEEIMLEVVAYHDPIDYHRLKTVVNDRVDHPYSVERHREALENLQELDMICRGGTGHLSIHISEYGWSHLGGENPRHQEDVETVSGNACDVCATDTLVR
jgi:hypothetical protein